MKVAGGGVLKAVAGRALKGVGCVCWSCCVIVVAVAAVFVKVGERVEEVLCVGNFGWGKALLRGISRVGQVGGRVGSDGCD